MDKQASIHKASRFMDSKMALTLKDVFTFSVIVWKWRIYEVLSNMFSKAEFFALYNLAFCFQAKKTLNSKRQEMMFYPIARVYIGNAAFILSNTLLSFLKWNKYCMTGNDWKKHCWSLFCKFSNFVLHKWILTKNWKMENLCSQIWWIEKRNWWLSLLRLRMNFWEVSLKVVSATFC